ncbi:MAG: type II toxin-antitoxin system VapC family toxin [Terriglobales bacterium]
MIRTWMLDTNTVGYIVRGQSPAARDRLDGLKISEVGCISVVTEAEIRYGLARKPPSFALRTVLDDFLKKIQIQPWGSDEAHAYGTVRFKLECAGKPLSALDMMIAAHAISTNATLVTGDKAFSQVEDLRPPVNWAIDL